MTLSFGGGAGVLTIPGLAGDGATPGGVVIDGAITAGDFNAVGRATDHEIGGAVVLTYTQGNIDDGDPLLRLNQGGSLAADDATPALYIFRATALNGHDSTGPLLQVIDVTASTGLLQLWENHLGTTVKIGQECGIGLFGKAPPTAPRTLAQATITAITDANAKAAVQACANALSDMGVLTLT